jgi:cytoskeleton protein RodZ
VNQQETPANDRSHDARRDVVDEDTTMPGKEQAGTPTPVSPDSTQLGGGSSDPVAPAGDPDETGSPRRLLEAREARGLSRGDVAQRLKLSQRQLEALETGDWEALPGRAFVRGALRAYGRLLDTDVTPILDRLGNATDPAILRPAATLDAPMPKSGAFGFAGAGRGSLTTWIVLALALVVALGLFFGRSGDVTDIKSWLDSGQGEAAGERPAVDPSNVLLLPAVPPSDGSAAGTVNPAPEPTPGLPGGTASPAAPAGSAAPVAPPAPAAPVPPATTGAAPGSPSTAPATASTSPPSPAPGTTAAAGTTAAPAAQRPAGASSAPLRIIASQDAWVEVRQFDGRIVFTDIVRAGTTAEVAGSEPISLVIGNANQVRVEYRGRAVELSPGANNIARTQLP